MAGGYRVGGKRRWHCGGVARGLHIIWSAVEVESESGVSSGPRFAGAANPVACGMQLEFMDSRASAFYFRCPSTHNYDSLLTRMTLCFIHCIMM